MEKTKKIKDITKIREKDLVFTDSMDRIFTFLNLDDYDWMSYSLYTSFHFKDFTLIVKFNYFGTTMSSILITKFENMQMTDYAAYDFDSDIFKKYITKYMAVHVSQWKKGEVFYGGNIAIKFYNEVMSSKSRTPKTNSDLKKYIISEFSEGNPYQKNFENI